MALPKRLLRGERGVTAVEYGLIVALIAVAAITALSRTGNSFANVLNNASNNLKAS